MYGRTAAGTAATSGALAFTGSNLALWTAIGLGLVIAGVCLIRVSYLRLSAGRAR